MICLKCEQYKLLIKTMEWAIRKIPHLPPLPVNPPVLEDPECLLDMDPGSAEEIKKKLVVDMKEHLEQLLKND